MKNLRKRPTIKDAKDTDHKKGKKCSANQLSTRKSAIPSAAPEPELEGSQERLTTTRKGTKRGMAVGSSSDNRSKKRSRRQTTKNTSAPLPASSSSSHEFDSAVEGGPLEKLLRKALPAEEEYWAPLVSDIPQEDRKEIGKCLVKYGKHLYPLILINLKLNLANKDKQPLQKGLLRFKPLYDMVKQKMHSLNDLERTLISDASSRSMYERLLTDEIIEAAAHETQDEGIGKENVADEQPMLLTSLLRETLPEEEEYWAPLVSDIPQEDRKEIWKCFGKYGKHLCPLILINLKLNLANKDKQPLQKGLLRFKPLYDMVKQKMHSLNDLERTLISDASSKRVYERLLAKN